MSDQAQTASTEAPVAEVAVPETPQEAVTTDTPSETLPVTEATPATEEKPAEPAEPELSEAEVEAIVAEMLKDIPSWEVTEPTFFPKKTDDVADDVKALEVVVEQYTESQQKADTLAKEKEEAIKKAAELETFVESVKWAYWNVTAFLWTELADKIAAWQFDEVPAQYNPEKWKNVESHPYLWPLVQKLLDGGEVDLPKLIREAAWKVKVPDVTTTPAVPQKEIKQETAQDRLVKWLLSRHWV